MSVIWWAACESTSLNRDINGKVDDETWDDVIYAVLCTNLPWEVIVLVQEVQLNKRDDARAQTMWK